jgi:hypothetical protein
MTHAEFSSESYDAKRQQLALDAMGYIQDILMDEDVDVDRTDLWCMTWDDLQVPIDDYEDASVQTNRNIVYNQIQSLYTDSLEQLYPQLKSVTSIEEMMLETAMIPDLPKCDGSFTTSQFRAENGNMRTMSYIEVRLGDYTALSLWIADDDSELLKSYNLTLGVDMTMWGGSNIYIHGSDQLEEEMVRKVHPSQEGSLLRVIHGNMLPYEMELKLAEIRMMSEDGTSELELNEVIEYAKARYYDSVEQNAHENASGIHDVTVDDLREMHEIIGERIEQLAYED